MTSDAIERVRKPAVKVGGVVFSSCAGATHHSDLYDALVELGLALDGTNPETGFLTTAGRFVGIIEADRLRKQFRSHLIETAGQR